MGTEGLLDGFSAILDPGTLALILVGALMGTVIGVLPGIGPVGAMAVLLPVSFGLPAEGGIVMLVSVYFGAMYGGSTTSILMRVPGEATSVVVAIDGYEMTKKGRGGAALAVAATGSFVAGTIAVLTLQFVSGPVTELTLQFSPVEYFALTVFALFVLSRLSATSLAATLVACAIGLGLATIGVDTLTGVPRFTLGFDFMRQGVQLVALGVGLYGVTEIMESVASPAGPTPIAKVRFRELYPTREEWRRATPAMARGGVIGFILGLIPGPAPIMSTYASYGVERRISKHKDEFGSGAIEAVAGPEAANNGASGGSMVPLLLLGVPFAPPTALLLAGLTIHGVTPGPLMINNDPDIFWTLIAGMYLANILLLVFNFPLVSAFTSLLRVPRDIMFGLIALLAVIGTYAARNSVVDVWFLVAMGALGYVMSRFGISRAALLLAFVIAGLMEKSLVQGLTLGQGDLLYFMSRPIAAGLLIATVLAAFAPALLRLRSRGGSGTETGLASAIHEAEQE